METFKLIFVIAGVMLSLLQVIVAINKWLGIGPKIVVAKNVKKLMYLEANPTRELRTYFSSSEQVQLYTAWLMSKSTIIVPTERQIRCKRILEIAVKYMEERDSRTTAEPFSTYFYTKTRA
ncbi:hypothetical protein VPHD518_0081 [Vibrio phage D518]